MNHNTPLVLPYYQYSNVLDNGKPYLQGTITSTARKSFARSFAGVDLPKWKALVALKCDATTGYVANDAKCTGFKPTHVISTTISGGRLYSQEVIDYDFVRYLPGDASTVDYSTADTKARTKFYDEMATAFDAGTFAGELKDTIRMLHRPAAALRAATDTYLSRAHRLRASVIAEARQEKRRLSRPGTSVLLANRANRLKAAERIAMERAKSKWRTALPESYLEWALGIGPLISDIEGVFERLKELLDEPGVEQFRVRAGCKAEIPKKQLTSTGHFKWNTNRYLTEHHSAQVQYRGAIYSVKHHNLTLTEKFAVGPGDLVVAGWNLLPHSYLVDYFVNIGDILNAVVLYQRIKYVFCCKTVRQKIIGFAENKSSFPDPLTKLQVFEDGAARVEVRKVTRSSTTAVPIPPLTLKIEQSLRHSLNIAALTGLHAEGKRFEKSIRL